MFFNNQSEEAKKKYISLLKSIGALTKLFSDSDVPLIHYRATENIFCEVFDAKNISRDDSAYDAIKNNTGIGIKTFICNSNNKFEKIAEFNKHSSSLKEFKGKALAIELGNLRNDRIDFADRTFKIEQRIYHCISRTKNKIRFFETTYDKIDVASIKVDKSSKASLHFHDNKNKYSFNHSKSTLFKLFTVPQDVHEIEIQVLENPFGFL